MAVLRKIDVVSAAKVLGVLGAIGGFVTSVLALAGAFYTQLELPMVPVSRGITSVVVKTILGGITGFVGGAFWAFVYNFVAKKIGGIKITIR